MNYGTKPISELDDWALTIAYDKCGQAEKQREKASQHSKFNSDDKKKKMEFPSINPQFTAMKNEIENEMKKRKLI